MGKLIKEIKNQFRIEFDNGNFDEWCVYLETQKTRRYAPTDIEYFARLQELGKVHGFQKIYDDFLKVYNLTDKNVSNSINDLITELSAHYGPDCIEIDMWFSVIYAGMIAEENKKYAILKKRIKRLGIYQVLIRAESPAYAANFSKGKKWRELDSIMKLFEI
jgi:hypothetical protein